MRNIPLILLLGALATGCSGNSGNAVEKDGASAPAHTPAAKKDVGESIATVGDAIIGTEEFRHAAARTQPMDGASLTDEERLEVLDQLVTEEVLFQEAMKKGLYQDSKVRKILVNLLLREDVYAGVKNDDFSDEVLMAYYEDHKDEFVVPDKVQVKRIFIRISPSRDDAAAKALADKLYADVNKDRRAFGELASQHSDGPYKRRGGDIGFISGEGKPGIEPEVVAKAFEMKVDEIRAPFKSGDGYHILYLVNRRERVERSFEQMKGSVVRMVKQDTYKKLTEEYIAAAKKRYPVKIDEKKVNAVDLGRSRPPRVKGHQEAPGEHAPH